MSGLYWPRAMMRTMSRLCQHTTTSPSFTYIAPIHMVIDLTLTPLAWAYMTHTTLEACCTKVSEVKNIEINKHSLQIVF